MTDELFEAIREDPVVEVPSDFVLVGRAFSLLSGIAHTLGGRANALDALGGRLSVRAASDRRRPAGSARRYPATVSSRSR